MNRTTAANRLYSLITASLLSVLSSNFAAFPAAADGSEPLKATVKFGDLDVSHPQGAIVLYRRIRAAAENVCAPFDGSGLPAKMRLNACVKHAIADAVTRVDKPALFAVYSAKMGETLPTRIASLQNR
jgi:UrcA family protein